MKTILTPVDFSPVTKRVVAEAAALARALDARIVLLSVTEPLPVLAVEGPMLDPRIVEWTDIAAEVALKRLYKIAEQLECDALRAESVHLVGSPATLIVEQAKKLPADYIVIGSHGHTAFYDVFVGSATRGVLKKASCPVVVVPAAKPKAPATRRRMSAVRGARLKSATSARAAILK